MDTLTNWSKTVITILKCRILYVSSWMSLTQGETKLRDVAFPVIPTPPFSHHLKAFGAKFKSASNRAALCIHKQQDFVFCGSFDWVKLWKIITVKWKYSLFVLSFTFRWLCTAGSVANCVFTCTKCAVNHILRLVYFDAVLARRASKSKLPKAAAFSCHRVQMNGPVIEFHRC